MSDRDLDLTIGGPEGIPLVLAGFLLQAIGAACPGTQVIANPRGSGRGMTVRIPAGDCLADIDDIELDGITLSPDDTLRLAHRDMRNAMTHLTAAIEGLYLKIRTLGVDAALDQLHEIKTGHVATFNQALAQAEAARENQR